MTTATTVESSGPAIRAVLAVHSPDECARFESEFRDATERAGRTFDLRPLDALLDRWWGIAVIRANPLNEAERAQVARARAGDETGWIVRHEDGTRTSL